MRKAKMFHSKMPEAVFLCQPLISIPRLYVAIMHLGPVPDKWLDEFPILVFEEIITAFADWPGCGKTDYQGGLFAKRIKYIRKIHLVWACTGQVYSLFNAHLVSLQ